MSTSVPRRVQRRLWPWMTLSAVFGLVIGFIVPGGADPDNVPRQVRTPRSSCPPQYNVLYVAVSAPGDASGQMNDLAEHLVEVTRKSLPFDSEAIERQTPSLVDVAERHATVLMLLRLFPGDAQIELAKQMVERYGSRVGVIAAGGEDELQRLGELAYRHRTQVLPLPGIDSPDFEIDEETVRSVGKWLRESFPCAWTDVGTDSEAP